MRPRLDPELGVVASAKKDDDLYARGGRAPGGGGGGGGGWRAKGAPRVPPRKTFKRLGLLLLLAVGVYVFIRNIPTDLGPQDKRHPFYTYPGANAPPGIIPKAAPPGHGSPDDVQGVVLPARNYDGAVRFLELAETLHAIGATKGQQQTNKNVLFMASSIKSAGILLPIACQMGKELRAYVHFALISRVEVPFQQLQDIHGITDDCHILFHDARPEFTSISSDDRFAKSVGRALYHINNYMHPQAIMVDSSEEELLFLRTLRQQAHKQGLGASIIELPSHGDEQVKWLTKLDASSLLHWNKVNIDILVHVHAGASGSLVRLLKSLSAADFTASAIPHLTIELPEAIDPGASQFLANFHWPPRSAQNAANVNQLTLKHRILKGGLNEEQSAAQFLEGFWPANPSYSHVLVLSPQVELSPTFFHYLKMAVLEYSYSSYALGGGWDRKLFGISLDLPSTHLSGSEPFTPPAPISDKAASGFLWQSPNSNAALFTGGRWVELHAFVSQLLEVQRSSPSPPASLAQKSVSREYPAWMEHALRLCRARGYWTLYPSAEVATNLATVHKDLYRLPEEYESAGSGATHEDEDEVVIHRASLLDSLPADEHLSRLQDMALLAWDGSRTTPEDLDDSAAAYVAEFRRTVGGCDGSDEVSSGTPLFCVEDPGI